MMQGSLDWDKWTDFVSSAGLKNVSVAKYYLGKEAKDCLDSEYGLILTGLLADAVAVGAVELPEGYAPEDFVFRNSPEHARQTRVILKNRPRIEPNGGQLNHYYVQHSRRMDHGNTNFVLGRIVAAIDLLAAADKAINTLEDP